MQTSISTEVLLPILMAFIMVGMGLSLTPQDFKRIFLKPLPAFVGLFGQLLLLPAIGFGVAFLMGLPGILAAGVVLVAVCPGGTMSNLICHLARGNVALSVSLTACTSVATLVTIPLLVNLAFHVFQTADAGVRLPVLATLGRLFLIVILPVMVGMTLRHMNPELATRSDKFFRHLSLGLMIVLVVGLTWSEWDTLIAGLAQVGLATFALNVVSVSSGLFLGRVFQLDHRDVVTLGIEIGIQNSALAILIALSIVKNAELALPAAVYSLVMYFTVAVLIGLMRRKETSELRQT